MSELFLTFFGMLGPPNLNLKTIFFKKISMNKFFSESLEINFVFNDKSVDFWHNCISSKVLNWNKVRTEKEQVMAFLSFCFPTDIPIAI